MFSLFKKILRTRIYRKIKTMYLDSPKLFMPNIQIGHMVNPATIAIKIGKDSLIRGTFSFEKNNAKLTVGTNTAINNSLFALAGEIDIGKNVLVSYGCLITDHNSHALDPALRRNDLSDKLNLREKDWTNVKMAPIVIEDDAWIGAHSIILKGVRIGSGSIIAAGSVVTKNVPAYSVAAGNPARVISHISSIERPSAND